MKNENIILIPARAGTTNISRQNLRLVVNKPLIYYVIKTALRYTKNVYVSTDSEEIEEISKLFGAKIIIRPKNLTKDSTKLEDVADHALLQICKNKNFAKCLILNPKYPLIELSTIKEFFSILNKNAQTVFGFVFNSHHQYKKIHFYKKNSGKIIGDLNNCVITEKIVSFNIQKFLKTKKFSSQFFGLKLSENELLALNSYHDFGILEKILNRKRILVRVDGNHKIGLGHVHNMLTILNHFRNEEILIVMDYYKKLGYKKFQEHLYNVKFFKKGNELFNIIKQFRPNIIFNDILDTEQNYMKKIKDEKVFVVNFEDLGSGRKNADLVFNPIFHSTNKNSNEYYGPEFACVRDEFRLWNPIMIRKSARKVVIIFGGVDPTNKTYQILKLLEKYQLKNLTYSIVIGQDYKNRKKLLDLISKMKKLNFNIILNENVDFLSKIFHESDFAITSNGRTVFELGSLHIPMIVVPVNKREKTHSFVQKYNVGYTIKLLNESTSEEFHNIFKAIIKYDTRRRFQNNLKQVNLLYGVDRVIQKINLAFEEKNKK
jgi:spore coat polysaccharide biosynthesis predicted glycosyltransferase SpsG/CMP-N-acetylneuraminic acid synthetase|tara:strand:- start:1000 stop:2634 length:1635 start_codon:yes stop_codon:yes gene_type:complete